MTFYIFQKCGNGAPNGAPAFYILSWPDEGQICFRAFFGGHLRLRSPRAPSGAPYKHLKSWTQLSSDIPHEILLILWRNSCYILRSYGILRFCTGSWWYMGIWGLRRGLRDLKNFTIERYRQKATKKSIIIFKIMPQFCSTDPGDENELDSWLCYPVFEEVIPPLGLLAHFPPRS